MQSVEPVYSHSSRYSVTKIMAFVVSHETACFIPYHCSSVFLVWHDEVTFYFLSYLSFRPQASFVICTANFLTASCCEEFIPGPSMHLSGYDRA